MKGVWSALGRLWGALGRSWGVLGAPLECPAAPKFPRLASSGFSSRRFLLLLASLNLFLSIFPDFLSPQPPWNLTNPRKTEVFHRFFAIFIYCLSCQQIFQKCFKNAPKKLPTFQGAIQANLPTQLFRHWVGTAECAERLNKVGGEWFGISGRAW